MVPTLLENFLVPVFVLNFFGNNIIMIMIEIQYSGTALLLLVNPMHTISKQWCHVPQLYRLSSDTLLTAMFNSLYSSTNQKNNFTTKSVDFMVGM